MHDKANDALVLESRRRIYEYVSARPGMHLRGIARSLSLPLGTALYHLDCLVNAELVVVRRDGRYKRFFANHTLGRREKDYISVFHHAVPRRIMAVLLAQGRRTQRELARDVGVSRSTLSFHVTNMVRQGILRCEHRWPENLYDAVEPELAARVVLEQRATFSDEVVERHLAALENALKAQPALPQPAPVLASP